MMIKKIFQTTLIAAFLVAGLSGCQADADGSASAGPNGNGTNNVNGDDGVNDDTGAIEGTDGDSSTVGNDDTGIPNSPGTAGLDDVANDVVGDDGNGGQTDIAGGGSGRRFLCTQAFDIAFGASTNVGANGLVGGPVSDLLGGLGGDPVGTLTNSVKDAEKAIDADLRTGSIFTLPASLLGTVVDTIDQNIYTPDGAEIPAGQYAVAAVSFPRALVGLNLLTTVTVTTFKGTTELESNSFDIIALDLLGQTLAGDPYAMIGLKVSKPYDRVAVALSASGLSVDVGDLMYLHEVCTGGRLIAE